MFDIAYLLHSYASYVCNYIVLDKHSFYLFLIYSNISSIFRDSFLMKFASNQFWYIVNNDDKFHKEP